MLFKYLPYIIQTCKHLLTLITCQNKWNYDIAKGGRITFVTYSRYTHPHIHTHTHTHKMLIYPMLNYTWGLWAKLYQGCASSKYCLIKKKNPYNFCYASGTEWCLGGQF